MTGEVKAISVRPITRDDAAAFIREHHRHHGVPVGDLTFRTVSA
jgi:hypothetical protein